MCVCRDGRDRNAAADRARLAEERHGGHGPTLGITSRPSSVEAPHVRRESRSHSVCEPSAGPRGCCLCGWRGCIEDRQVRKHLDRLMPVLLVARGSSAQRPRSPPWQSHLRHDASRDALISQALFEILAHAVDGGCRAWLRPECREYPHAPGRFKAHDEQTEAAHHQRPSARNEEGDHSSRKLLAAEARISRHEICAQGRGI